MAVWIDIARSMARVIVVLAWHVPLATSIPVAVFVEIAGHVARVIVVLSWHLLLPARVAVTVGVEITRRMSGMVVMRAKLLFGHLRSPLLWIVLERFLISLHRNQRLQNSSSIPGVSRGPRCGR
ncbi:hypothetical protein, partial [Sphingomonas sp. BK481]|uniref:hypothetical protein n=1 Tax=Sphingomonas sp. BK481 TaxID=2586981 RepID=UPI001619A312